jgi:hypothetical protein
LRIGEARHGRQRGSASGELQEPAAWECHGSPPDGARIEPSQNTEQYR